MSEYDEIKKIKDPELREKLLAPLRETAYWRDLSSMSTGELEDAEDMLSSSPNPKHRERAQYLLRELNVRLGYFEWEPDED